MSRVTNAAYAALKKSLGVKPGERVLIVTDTKKEAIARVFLREAEKITKVELVSMKPRKIHGEEPPGRIAEAMKAADAVLLITEKSLSHTMARMNATKVGARIASMPGITMGTIIRCLDADYERIKRLTERICGMLDKAKEVRIITKLGTDLKLNVRGRKAHGRNAGIYKKRGAWGNLPEGEACIAPVEGRANGVFICDTTNPLRGTVLKNPITVVVENGYAAGIEGSREAQHLHSYLRKLGKKSFNIGELGIGTHYKARIVGNVLEDEKVLGTCHIALGDNLSLGGKVHAKSHLDFVIRNPEILLDGDITTFKKVLRF